MQKKIIKAINSSCLAKLSIFAILAISTIMTIGMHGNVLAVGEAGYQLTVNVPSYPFGTSILGISITTANGYTDHASVATSGTTSWTFNIPANQGGSVRVCINSDNSSAENCDTYNTTGSDMSVSLSPSSGNDNSNYIYPGNSYYVYPSDRYYIYPANGYDHYIHHDYDHGFDDHHDYDHGFDDHHNTGNIGLGNSGNNIGYGGHQNNGFGGHQNSGNRGVVEPGGHVHHTSQGEPIIDAESSDDDD